MKRTFLLKMMLLLCALVAGSSSVWAEDVTVSWTASSGALGSTISAVNGTASGTISTGDFTWNYTRTFAQVKSSKSDYIAMNSGYMQCGSSNARENLLFTTSNISGTIKSVSVDCASSIHNLSITVGGTSYYNGDTPTWSNSSGSTITRTGTSSGDIEISFTSSSGLSPLYIKSISVTYAATPEGTTTAPTINGDTPFLDNTTVTITNAASADGADIYYTLNGDDPTTTTSSTCFAYTDPFEISATTTVKAIAKKSTDTNASSVVSKTFTKATILTVAQARTAIDDESIHEVDFVRGIIANIGTLSNGALTYWISDDGNMTTNIQCYKGKNIDGEDFAATTDIEIGDIVIVKGELEKYNNTTYQFKADNEVVSITTRTKVNIATFTAETTTLALDGTTTTNTTVTNDQAGWTPNYSYTSSDATVATVDNNGVITAVAKGTANITVTPNVSATDPTYKVGESKYIEITVKNPSHTATFSVNGVTSGLSVEEGENITFPTNPAAIDGKAFVGWANEAIDGTTNTAPTLVNTTTEKMGNSNKIYYAVFASGTETSGWQKVTASNVSEAGTYALLTTDGHAFNGTINDNGHGQVTTSAFTFVNDYATSAPDGTCEITLVAVTGGYQWYNSDNGYLYAKAASSGNLDWKNTENSYWAKSGSNWKYNSNNAYLRSYNNNSFRTYSGTSGSELVFAKKTTIASYSDYCTTVVPGPSNPVDNGETITLTTTENMDGWRTFYDADHGYTADNNTTVYVASENTETKVTLEDIGSKNIPSGTPVILKTSAANRQITLTKGDIPAINVTNTLQASEAGDNLGTVYRLGYGSDGISFYKYTTTSAPAGIVYVPNVGNTEAPSLTIEFGSGATSIETIKSNDDMREVYNLNGQRIAQPTKGLYVVNGKKVIIK